MAGKKGRSGRTKGKSLSPRVQEEIRQKINTVKIVNLLQQNIEGEVKMDAQQVQSARILLDKTLPSLSSVEQNYGSETLDAVAEILNLASNKSRSIPSKDGG